MEECHTNIHSTPPLLCSSHTISCPQFLTFNLRMPLLWQYFLELSPIPPKLVFSSLIPESPVWEEQGSPPLRSIRLHFISMLQNQEKGAYDFNHNHLNKEILSPGNIISTNLFLWLSAEFPSFSISLADLSSFKIRLNKVLVSPCRLPSHSSLALRCCLLRGSCDTGYMSPIRYPRHAWRELDTM